MLLCSALLCTAFDFDRGYLIGSSSRKGGREVLCVPGPGGGLRRRVRIEDILD
jgi:hypothetical protein